MLELKKILILEKSGPALNPHRGIVTYTYCHRYDVHCLAHLYYNSLLNGYNTFLVL